MPIYQCASRKGLLNDEMKAKMATAITDAHVEMTGAPRLFVHVFFNEYPPGTAYSGDGPDTKISGITGQVRDGRSVEVKQKLIQKIVAKWTEITGQPAKEVIGGISERKSLTQREDGMLLPHPGEEAEWFKKNADTLDRIQGTGL